MSRGYTLLWSDKSLRRYECADEKWYRGTAGAIFQNLDLIDDLDEHLVALEEEGRPTQAIGSMIWGGCVLSGG